MGDFSRSDRWLLAAILLAALFVRIAYLVDIADSIYLHYPLLDSAWYDAKARDVLAGDYLAAGASFRVPLYVYFLAGCYAVFGESFAAPLIIQALLGAATCGLIFLIGRRIFGTPAGAAGGLAFAFYRMAIYSDGEILPTTLFMLFMLLAVWSLLECLDRMRYRDAALAGAWLGLGFLTRPDIFLFAAAMVAVMVVLNRSKRGLRLAGVVIIVFAGFLMLLGVRNYTAYGRLFLVSPQGAVNLYIGNASFADGRTPLAPPTRYVYGVSIDPGEDSIIEGCRIAARENVGRELSDPELSGYYTRKTLAEITSGFPRWAGLMLRKAYYFLAEYERSDMKPVQRFISRYSEVLGLPLLTYSVVMPFGLVGLVVSLLRRKKNALVPAAGLAAWALLTVAFFVVWRYRLPAVPFMAVLGGYALCALVEAAAGRRYRAAGIMLASAAVLWAASSANLLAADDTAYLPTHLVNEGALFEAAGRHEEAVEIFEEAIEMQPADARPYYHAGRAYAVMGRRDRAREYMEAAVARNPNYRPFAYVSLGIPLARAGEYREAAGYFEKAVEADPGLCIAAYNLGLCRYNLGERGEAAEALIRAAEVCGSDAAAMVSISRMLTELGQAERAVSLGRAALEMNPRNPEALYAVGLGYEALGRYGEALSCFERALEYMPSSKELRDKIREVERMREP